MLVTIFTPTYNRAYRLIALYESLCRQTCKDFEWLIVDDGSSDNTELICKQWVNESKVNIRYYKQVNGGKHKAINLGVSHAMGQLFMIVDSDDYLANDAVEWIKSESGEIINDNSFAGLAGIRVTSDGNKIGGGGDFGIIDANSIDIRLRYKIKGDLAEIFKTSVLKKYPFPSYDDENFCPEALVWNRIAHQFKMRFIHSGIYIGEYLPDGLTAKITRIRHTSPKASMIFYAELFHTKGLPVSQYFKAAINYWRFHVPGLNLCLDMNTPISFLSYIPGKLFKVKDTLSNQI